MAHWDAFKSAWRRAVAKKALTASTSDSYLFWVRRLFVVCGRRDFSTWGPRDWERLEWWLAEQRPSYSLSSRHQARNALNFVFHAVLGLEVGKLDLPKLPRPEPALVVVPTREEIGRILTNLKGQERLACRIMHGSGARVQECCRIRVQDIDLERARVRLWDGKGEKNRETVLPRHLLPILAQQIAWRRVLHERDVADGNGFVEVPSRIARKFRGAPRELGWQWLLASSVVSAQHRWYLSPDSVGGALLAARRAAGIVKRVTCHALRKAFATEAMQAGMDVRTIQALLGHADLKTTANHYLAIDLRGAFSPADVPTERLRPALALAYPEVLTLA